MLTGFRQVEVFADNREYYDRCARDPAVACAVSMTREEALWQRKLLARFPPGIEHVRTVAQRVEEYVLAPPFEKIARKNGFILRNREQLEEKPMQACDLGAEVLTMCEEDRTFEQMVDEKAVHRFPDGTEIRGVRVRTTPRNGPVSCREAVLSSLRITYDASRFAERREFTYEAQMTPPEMTPETPRAYVVAAYVAFNGSVFDERSELLEPLFLTRETPLGQSWNAKTRLLCSPLPAWLARLRTA